MEQIPSFFEKKTTINYGGRLIDLSEPLVMGIMNVTPDSFYEGSRNQTEKTILARAQQIIEEEGSIIDLGAYSSRPNAAEVSGEEEYNRIYFALRLIKKHFPDAVVSIDTFRAMIVERVYNEFGAVIVNDISAGEIDPLMFKTVGQLHLPYIAMHMKGTPQTMMHQTHYTNLLQDIIDYFVDKIIRLRKAGVHDIILDPGYGFSKTLEQNFELLARLTEFKIFELPILVGISRKSMIYKTLNTTANEALNGTTVLNTLALQKGADILRVHDVKEAVETVKIMKQYNNSLKWTLSI